MEFETVGGIYKVISETLTKNSTLTELLLVLGYVGKIEINVAPDCRIKDIKYEYTYNLKREKCAE